MISFRIIVGWFYIILPAYAKLYKSWNCKPIYDGELYIPSVTDYSTNVRGGGVGNSTGLRLDPDRWHSPSLRMYGDLWRSDFSIFDFIQLYVRCASKPVELNLHFGRWTANNRGSSSASCNLTNFIYPKSDRDKFNATWSYVRVPIAAFNTSDWTPPLKGVEIMYFNKDALNRHCYIDDIALLRYNKTFSPTFYTVPSPTLFTSKSPSNSPTVNPTYKPSSIPSSVPTRQDIQGLHDSSTAVRLSAVPGVLPLLDAEAGSFKPASFEYARYSTSGGIKNSSAFLLLPDSWHSPSFVLLSPAYRGDIAQYNQLILFAKCPTDTPLSIHFGRWTATPVGYESASALLGQYADPLDTPIKSIIGNTWTKVKIPIPQFFTADWKLSGAERIYFNLDPLNRKCMVDNIFLRENVGPRVLSVEAISQSHVKIVMSKYYRRTDARQVGNYLLTDSITQVARNPKSIGLSTRFQRFKDSSMVPLNEHVIYLRFDPPLQCSGKHLNYSLLVANISDPAENPMNSTLISFNCSLTSILSSAIKVNQIGYLPKRPKVAYVGDYYADIDGGVWAVGANCSIWTWTRVSNRFDKVDLHHLLDIQDGSLLSFRAVVANSPGDVWVVGDRGTIIHFNGYTWLKVPCPAAVNLLGIDFNSNRTFGIAVGENGTLLRFVPNKENSLGQWLVMAKPAAVNRVTLRTVWIGKEFAWIGGDEGLILKFSITTNTLVVLKSPTTESVLKFGGLPTDGNPISALCSNGTVLRNYYGNWLVNFVVAHANFSTMVVHPTYNKAQRYVGQSGVGFATAYNQKQFFNTNTNSDLTSIVFINERTVFAFGLDGACVQGDLTGAISNWTATCFLPGATDVYAAAAVIEGPMRLPFPRPVAQLQKAVSVHGTTSLEWTAVKNISLSLRTMNYHLSGEDVFAVDFSSIRQEGVYRIFIPGLGVSHTFPISNRSHDIAEYHTCRMLYYQRSGMPGGLQVPFAEPRFARPIDHEYNLLPGGRRIDAAYHWSVGISPLYAGEITCPLSAKSCPLNTTADGTGGWFDAGDYGKYIATATVSVWKLLVLVDIMTDLKLPQSDSRNIPESNDGVPDTLNEATWEIDWMMKMQRLDDGGVYNRVSAEVWEGGAPHVSDLGRYAARYFLPRTTHDTATTGAVFAYASRLWSPYNATKAAEYLDRAKLCLSFLEKYSNATPSNGFVNPPGFISGVYSDPIDTDNRAWLAAELYRTTCQVAYGSRYVAYITQQNRVDLGQNEFIDFGKPAAWAFYHSGRECTGNGVASEPPSFNVVRSKVFSALTSSVLGSYDQIYSNTYQNVGRTDVPEWIGWGLFSLNGDSYKGILGWYLLKSTKYLDAMVATMDTVLGANPLGVSFITGLGTLTPQDPLQGQSRSDNVSVPIPGYGVMGPYAHVSNKSPMFAVAQSDDNNFPSLGDVTSPFPILRRWSDSNLLPQYNEGEIRAITFHCAVFQILNAVEQSSTEIAYPPTKQPSRRPSMAPTVAPTSSSSLTKSNQPTRLPSARVPTSSPTKEPLMCSSSNPSNLRTVVTTSTKPSTFPTTATSNPTTAPTSTTSNPPTRQPTRPSSAPTSTAPTKLPTSKPTGQPTRPSSAPTLTTPTKLPTSKPTGRPSSLPTSTVPTKRPTSRPSRRPSSLPTSTAPTMRPISKPTGQPTRPSSLPTVTAPTKLPTSRPTRRPTFLPTSTFPTMRPTPKPRSSSAPTSTAPTKLPSSRPTRRPSFVPTTIAPKNRPTFKPTGQPTRPSSALTVTAIANQRTPLSSSVLTQPLCGPTSSEPAPALTSMRTTAMPSTIPSKRPSSYPLSRSPSMKPSKSFPTISPTKKPNTSSPSRSPSTIIPHATPSARPTTVPSVKLSVKPTSFPRCTPTKAPTSRPTVKPVRSPSLRPSTITPSRKTPTSSPTKPA